jgi:hypothetical protein
LAVHIGTDKSVPFQSLVSTGFFSVQVHIGTDKSVPFQSLASAEFFSVQET